MSRIRNGAIAAALGLAASIGMVYAQGGAGPTQTPATTNPNDTTAPPNTTNPPATGQGQNTAAPPATTSPSATTPSTTTPSTTAPSTNGTTTPSTTDMPANRPARADRG